MLPAQLTQGVVVLLLQALINANKAWATRAGGRLNTAATNINLGVYKPEHLFRDALRWWVTDPVDWYLDLVNETNTRTLVIDVRVDQTGGRLSAIPARNPDGVTISALSRLGGTERMDPGTHVDVRRDPDPEHPECVVITTGNLTQQEHPEGEYLGFLMDGELVIAYVLVRRQPLDNAPIPA
jgi:hypothetical protein